MALWSPSSRRAWIEIRLNVQIYKNVAVALLAEGVDRNYFMFKNKQGLIVALLAEGVDRNY